MDASDPATKCYAVELGRMEYGAALELQMRLCDLKKQGMQPDFLLLLEHPPVITLGRSGKWGHLRVAEEELRKRGVASYEVDRGGDITFHGPGQLVGYPILRLGRGERDVHRYMRNLEESLIRVLELFAIEARRSEGLTGVWTGQGKIAAMGVHLSRWITRHGFALNVSTDLSWFELIVPCGIEGKAVTSMSAELGRSVPLDAVARRFVETFGEVFGREMITGLDLEAALDRAAAENLREV